MQFRTFGWIARQNPHIRILKDGIEDDKKYEFPHLENKSPQVPIEDRRNWFKKGELWPTIILVEKGWDESGTKKKEDAYIRIFRHSDGAILDILVGESLDEATLLAVEYNVPLFSVTCSRKGTRGTAQRIHMDII
ncbi:MAG: hypothetical protein JSV04_00775 [Candidatus Heimdallarchaeota archaeon]|nr:MAG: hypothetical protein JSV04_00775 [Candidatus Heimdallarchaeota archaeon]